MKKNIFILMAVVLGTVACNESIAPPQNDNNSSALSIINYQNLDFSGADIGNLNNSYVDAIYQDVNFASYDGAETKMRENFKKIDVDVSPLGVSRSDWNDIVFGVLDSLKKTNFSLESSYFQPLKNRQCYNYLKRILDEINDETPLSQFIYKIQLIENEAVSHLNSFDLDIVLGAAKTAKNSAKLWYPKSDGGLGRLDSISVSLKFKQRAPIEQAILADVQGSMGYWMTIGIGGSISLAFVPGTNVALLGGWALSTAFSSALGWL